MDTQADVDKNQLDRFCTEKGDKQTLSTKQHQYTLVYTSPIQATDECSVDLFLNLIVVVVVVVWLFGCLVVWLFGKSRIFEMV